MTLQDQIRHELNVPSSALSDEKILLFIDTAMENLQDRVLINLVKLYISANFGDTENRDHYKRVLLGKLEIKE